MSPHDHPLDSGGYEQGICRGLRVEQAAVEDAAEEVGALGATVEPVAELIQVGLQMGAADAVEDIERPALEVGEHDVRPRQPLIDVGAGGQGARAMAVTGRRKASVAVPA